jgi:hypothetical protein
MMRIEEGVGGALSKLLMTIYTLTAGKAHGQRASGGMKDGSAANAPRARGWVKLEWRRVDQGRGKEFRRSRVRVSNTHTHGGSWTRRKHEGKSRHKDSHRDTEKGGERQRFTDKDGKTHMSL